MTELSDQIRQRALDALASLREARASGDDYLAQVREAELETLARLADEHGLTIPELRAHTSG